MIGFRKCFTKFYDTDSIFLAAKQLKNPGSN